MDSSRLCFYIITINCVLLIPSSFSKTFSLNEAIASEKSSKARTRGSVSKPFSINEAIAAEKYSKANSIDEVTTKKAAFKSLDIADRSLPFKKHKFNLLAKRYSASNNLKEFAESIKSKGKLLSPLKYKKFHQITLPIKPKSLGLKKLRLGKYNQSRKREIIKHETINEKYIPLLRNIGDLFDNLLKNVESDAYDNNVEQSERIELKTEDGYANCPCAHESHSPKKETITATPDKVSTDEIEAEASSVAVNYIAPRYVSRFRQNSKLPLLLSRNTPSHKRNDNGIRKRSGTTRHRSAERNISRNNGDGQHNSRGERNLTSSANYQKHTCSDSRNCTSGNGTDVGFGRTGDDAGDRKYSTKEASGDRQYNTTEAEYIRTELNGLKVEDQFETTENQTGSTEPIRGGFISENTNSSEEFLQPEKKFTEGVVDIGNNITSTERVSDGSSSLATEDKGLHIPDATLSLVNNLPFPPQMIKNLGNNKLVTIIDGYSVTRGKFGENKLTEKAVHIH